MRKITLLVAALAAFVAACHADGPKPVNDREAKQFAAAYSAAILQPNVGKAAAMFDWDAVAERAGEGVEPGHSFLLRQVLRKLSARVFVTSLSDSARAGDFQLLHVRTANGETTALMRLIMSNKSVNYYEMLLRRGDDGIVRAVDVYVFSSGAYTSEVFREAYRANLMRPNWFLDLLNGRKSPLAQHLTEYREMLARVQAHDYKRAEEIYQSLPAELRGQKSLMTLHVNDQARLGSHSDAYLKALDEFRAAWPNAHGADFLAVDAFLLRKQYDDALHAVDRIDAAVGGDPYQDTIRAGICLQRSDLQCAHDYAARAAQREPTLKRAWWQQVDVAIKRSDYPEVARLLTVLRDRLGIKITDLRKAPFYAGFVRSDEYKAWAASR